MNKKSLIASFIILIILEVSSFFLLQFLKHSSTFQNWEKIYSPRYKKKMTWVFKYSYHPYLTYSNQQNNGNQIEKVYSSKVRIGVFGGSFAQMFADFLMTDKGKKRLKNLSKEIGELKEIEILNMAAGGYRQPQQLISSILNYDKVDLFLSIEGFNELTNRRTPCRPPDWNMHSLRFDKNNFSVFSTFSRFFKKAYLFLHSVSELNISFIRLIFYFLGEPLYQLYKGMIEKHINYLEKSCKSKSEKEEEFLIQNWIKDIKKYLHILNSSGKISIVVMQPNQYYGSKKWTKFEKKIFSKNILHKKIKALYPTARQRFLKLKTHHQFIVDITTVFDKENETIYIDECCHINKKGNQIVFKALKPHLTKAIKLHLNKGASF